jgi:hypothetical protein
MLSSPDLPISIGTLDDVAGLLDGLVNLSPDIFQEILLPFELKGSWKS